MTKLGRVTMSSDQGDSPKITPGVCVWVGVCVCKKKGGGGGGGVGPKLAR